jgi:glycine dehydrogenase
MGSASILTISWAYIAMMGADGLKLATEAAILNANYMAKRLSGHYSILYTGKHGRCAHEFILDLREFKTARGRGRGRRQAADGLRLPRAHDVVAGSGHVDGRAHRERVARRARSLLRGHDPHPRRDPRVVEGAHRREDNPLKNAPHTAAMVTAENWKHPYTREEAAFPAPWTRRRSSGRHVARVDNAYGDRNLICTLPADRGIPELAVS